MRLGYRFIGRVGVLTQDIAINRSRTGVDETLNPGFVGRIHKLNSAKAVDREAFEGVFLQSRNKRSHMDDSIHFVAGHQFAHRLAIHDVDVMQLHLARDRAEQRHVFLTVNYDDRVAPADKLPCHKRAVYSQSPGHQYFHLVSPQHRVRYSCCLHCNPADRLSARWTCSQVMLFASQSGAVVFSVHLNTVSLPGCPHVYLKSHESGF